MTKSKHTPGPWEVIQVCDDVYIECANLDEKSVKTICSLSRKSDYANADLISAAPELLEALEEFVEGATKAGIKDFNSSLLRKAKNAIEKAKGAL